MRLLMPMGAIAVALCVNDAAVLFNITNALAQNAPITDCDQLAAHPNDPERKVDGILLSKIDTDKAIPACETAVRQYPNDARLSYQLARAYYGAKNYQDAIDQFRKAAEQGYAPAQYTLGLIYTRGRGGVAKDGAQAVAWFRKAADQGYVQAQDSLGSIYLQGLGVAQDFAEAVTWYRKAAEQGYAAAQNNLGSMYLNGRGVSQDDAEAASWFRKAAEQGYGPAQGNLWILGIKGSGGAH